MKPILDSLPRLGLLVFIASGVACAPGAPSSHGPVRLAASIDQQTIAPGATATITFQLENVTTDHVTLSFGHLCQVLPYIRDSQTSAVVHPAGGDWFCAAAISTLELSPGEAVRRDVQVQAGGTAAHPVVVLDPGQYAAYATLGLTSGGVRLTGRGEDVPENQRLSNTVSFTVQ